MSAVLRLASESRPTAPVMDYGTPEYRLIPLVELFIDSRYQRILNEARVGKYAKRSLSGPLLGALIVSRRKDGYAVLDGQHRMALVKLKDQGSLLPCLVYDVPSSEIEAELFILIQELRKDATPYERHRGRVHRGDPVAVGIEAIATECGFRIAGSNSVRGTISAVKEMASIYVTSPEILQHTLTIIRDAYGLDEQDARSRTILVGIARFLRHAAPTWQGGRRIERVPVDTSDLAKKLSKQGDASPQRIIRTARGMAKDTRSEVATSAAREIARIYNLGRRSGRVEVSGHLLKGGWS